MSENEEPKRFLTLNEVAALVRVSRSTVYREMVAGRLATVRIARRSIRVTPEQLAAWLGSLVSSPSQSAPASEFAPGGKDHSKPWSNPNAKPTEAKQREYPEGAVRAADGTVWFPAAEGGYVAEGRDENYATLEAIEALEPGPIVPLVPAGVAS